MAKAMKDSGIKWIGEIPENWKTVKIKQIADPKIKDSFQDGDWIESPYITDNGIIYFTTGNIGDGVFKNQDKSYISLETFNKLNCKYAYPGDLIISRLNAPYGRSCILPNSFDKCIIAVDNVILRPKKEYDKRYICYVTQCIGFHDNVYDFARGTAMKRISRNNLGNIFILQPPELAQKNIADFLDKKCQQIDSVLEKTRESIEEYKKLKNAVITQAVTKGIRPNRKMKDSGIEWIGDIPDDWEVRRIKTLFKLRDEKSYKPLNEVNLISLYTDKGVMQHSDIEYVAGNKASNADGYKCVYENDIVVNIILCWMGAIGRSAYNGVTSPAYDVYKPLTDTNSFYYHYYFRTPGFNGECFKRGRGIMLMRWRTYSDDFTDIHVCYPSKKEQSEIADYLDKKCSQIDNLISKKEQLITELETYKKSLIYEYVTGKKEIK